MAAIADVDDSVSQGRAAPHGVFRFEAPPFPAGLAVQRVEVLVLTPKVDYPIGEKRRRYYRAAGLKAPLLLSGLEIQGVEIVV